MKTAQIRALAWRALAWCLALGMTSGAATAWAQPRGPAPDAARSPAEGQEAARDPGIGSELTDVEELEDQGMPWSEGISFDQRRAARELFREANALSQGRFFATAMVKYRQAIELWPHPAFYYNLFVVQMSLDDPVSAHRILQEAMRHGADPLGQDKYDEARQYDELLMQQLARVVIECDVPGAEVSMDGRPLFTGPGRHEEVMRPGSYHLEASKAGHIADSRTMIAAAGRETRVHLVLTYRATERRMGRWLPWTTLGLGAALAATGGVLHRQSAREFDDYDREFGMRCAAGCDSWQEIMKDLHHLHEKAEKTRDRATIVYAASGAVLAAGTMLLYLNREREVIREARGEGFDTSARASALSIEPILLPETVGVSALLRF